MTCLHSPCNHLGLQARLQGSGQRLPTCDPRPATDAGFPGASAAHAPARTVPGARPARGLRGGRRTPARRSETTDRPCSPDPEREPGRSRRAADRRPMGRGTTRRRSRDAAGVHLSPPVRARIERHRGPSARLPAPCRTRRDRCASLRTTPARRPPRCLRARAAAATLAEALDLWRGPALADLATEPRSSRDRPAGGTPAPGHRGGGRVGPRPGPARGGRRRARGAHA